MNKANLIYVLTIAMWSSLAVLSISVSHLDPLLSVGLVLLIASLPSWPKWRCWRLSPGHWLAGLIGMFGYHVLLFDAFGRSPAVNVNLVQYLWPLFIVVASPLFSGKRLNWGHSTGALLGFSAVVLCLGGQQVDWHPSHLFGYVEAVIAASFWAYYSLYNSSKADMPVAAVGGFCLVAGLMALGSYGLTQPQLALPQLSGSEWLSILGLGLGPMGLAFYTWDYCMRHGDPRVLGAASYLTPVLSMLLIVAVFPEHELSLGQMVALALVILGASLGPWVAKRQSAKPQSTTLEVSPSSGGR
ncbi:DMT family transporter [Aliagarivorans taiwanensis]|uniref:DMT family transporter n=1 Tax=Aliagarivorans taiwanensis TaxID=561966 RepID=UPI0004038D2F|nr:EamA family transporter [Aliagarivorans taiwanensis]